MERVDARLREFAVGGDERRPRARVVFGLGETAKIALIVVGTALLASGFGLCVAIGSIGEGVLVWLSMAMFAFSLLVVAAPLVDRFVPITTALAMAAAVIVPWM